MVNVFDEGLDFLSTDVSTAGLVINTDDNSIVGNVTVDGVDVGARVGLEVRGGDFRDHYIIYSMPWARHLLTRSSTARHY